MNRKPNNRKQQILDFVDKQVEEKGYPPSVREICAAVGFKSTSTVHDYLEKLEKEGLIKKDPSKPRALKVVGSKSPSSAYRKNQTLGDFYPRKELVDVPIIGKVAAGLPILAVENIEDTYPIPVDMVQNSTAFMLKVRGESMIEAGILDGDLILVRQQSTAINGDIVVALIEDEATVKTFYKENGYVRLQPQNQSMDPIIVHENLSILGKVIGVFRRV